MPFRLTLVLASAVYLTGAGEFMLAPLLAPLAAAFQCSPAQVTWLIASHAVAYAAAAPLIAVLGYRCPKRQIIRGSLLLFSLTALALPLMAPIPKSPIFGPTGVTAGFILALLLRSLGGVAAAALIPTTFALIADLVSIQQQTRAMSFVMLGMTIGIASGPVLAGFLTQWIDWRMPFIAIALLSLIIRHLVERFIPVTSDPAREKHLPVMAGIMTSSLLRPLAAKAVWLNLAVSGYLLSGEVLRLRYGLTTAEIGLAAALFGIGLGIGNLSTGWLEQHIGHSTATLLASLAGIEASILIFLLPQGTLIVACGALCFWGISLGVAAPVSTVILASRAGQAAGLVLATSESFNNIALMLILPFAASQLETAIGRLCPILLIGMGLAFALSLFDHLHRPKT